MNKISHLQLYIDTVTSTRCSLDIHCCFVVAVFVLFLAGVFVVLALKISLLATDYDLEETLGDEEDNLDATDDREPREESHRSSNETHLLQMYIFIDLGVKSPQKSK